MIFVYFCCIDYIYVIYVIFSNGFYVEFKESLWYLNTVLRFFYNH